jgi:cob(I)alamin adenosyltransferase
MRLYTGQGDRGETGLIGGERVAKDHPRVAAYGDVDELNAALGVAATVCDEELADRAQAVQEQLFVLGAELSSRTPDESTPCISAEEVKKIEGWIDEASDAVTPLQRFVLPGGSEAGARFHLARTVCRRAERSVVSLSLQECVSPQVIIYLNRVSDLLFAWARLANARAGVPDVEWHRPASP